ncbi:DNA-binding protein [Kocuria flava]|uniref:Holo-[acyl-carrier-protein] synthase n=1 Tax=Kocuria flava TaxID=446860 RepID=A0A2N4T255_9MICC|nr:holo-ACP synthase [Kocuria flava]PLC12319.1 DNA-binding protein [Kocuria flava]
MIIGTGIDVVDVARFEAQIARTPGLVERLFTPGERGLHVRSLAARFAAKEAAAKALKAPPGMIWQHCWIEKDPSGAPVLRTEGTVADEARRQGIDRWHLTMTHDGGIAMAMVVAERTAPEDPAPGAPGREGQVPA